MTAQALPAVSTLAPLEPSDSDPAPSDAEALFSTLYGELHRMARRELSRRGRNMTLGATTLLHEAYLGMSARSGMAFPDQARFMAYAARTMRGLIIDHVRRRYAHKRGGLYELTPLDTTIAARLAGADDLQQISAAVEPVLAEIVDLKFFCGFSFAEIAAMRGVSERTVQRHWEKARLYLHHAIAT